MEKNLKPEIDNKVKLYNSIEQMQVDLTHWYTELWVGYNLSYNIWDEVIEDYLLKN